MAQMTIRAGSVMRSPAPIVKMPRNVLINNTEMTSNIVFEKFLKNLLNIILFPAKKLLKGFALSGVSIIFGANPMWSVFSIELMIIKSNEIRNNPKMMPKIEFESLKYSVKINIFDTINGIDNTHLAKEYLKLCLMFVIKFLV